MRKKVKNLHTLPRVRNSWSYLYVERCLIEKKAEAVCVIDQLGRVPLPIACLTLLMLGPGVSISHAAVLALTEAAVLLRGSEKRPSGAMLLVWVRRARPAIFSDKPNLSAARRNVLKLFVDCTRCVSTRRSPLG